MPNPFKLLTIDHDPESLKTLKDVSILHPDFHVTHLDSTEVIYEIVHYQSFDMALCDFNIAKEDDFRLVHTLYEANANIAILLLIDSSKDQFTFEALKAGADGFLNKPLSYSQFSLTLMPGFWTALDRPDWWIANEEKLAPLKQATA